jgi:hypothetical protein
MATKFERGYPTPETVEKAYDDADLNRAVQAYRFFYPPVSGAAIVHPARFKHEASVSARAEQGLIEHYIAHTAMNKPMCCGLLPDLVILRPLGMALLVSSVPLSLTMFSGLRRRAAVRAFVRRGRRRSIFTRPRPPRHDQARIVRPIPATHVRARRVCSACRVPRMERLAFQPFGCLSGVQQTQEP